MNNQNENMMGAVAYFLGPITGVLLLLTEKSNKTIRFHAMQSTILFGGLFVVNLIVALIPFLGLLLSPLLTIGGFVLWIMLMWKAFNGEKYSVPYVGKIAEEQLAKMG